MERTHKRLTRPLLTRTEALALALLLGMPLASSAFADAELEPDTVRSVQHEQIEAFDAEIPG